MNVFEADIQTTGNNILNNKGTDAYVNKHTANLSTYHVMKTGEWSYSSTHS